MLLFSVTIKDCEVQEFCGSGPGGQHKNRKKTAIRITHRASGAVGVASDSREQLTNKRNAFVRMFQTPEFQKWHKLETGRRLGVTDGQVKYGEGSRGFGARYLRTYDFPDKQVIDHETRHVRKDMDHVMNGDIDSFIMSRMIYNNGE